MKRFFDAEDDFVIQIYDQLRYLLKIRTLPSINSVNELTREELSRLIDIIFGASMRTNEGRTTRVCVTLVDRESFTDSLAFLNPVTYDEVQIIKLAPAVPRGGCLAVTRVNGGLSIWGFGRSRPGSFLDTVTLEASEPGTVRVGVGPFQPFAVISGRSSAIIHGTHTDLASYLQRVLKKALPVNDINETQAVWRECIALADLSRTIVADGHGGCILIVPAETGAWSGSLNPFAYPFSVPDTSIRDAIREELNDGQANAKALEVLWASSLSDDVKNLVSGALTRRPRDIMRGVQTIASLAAVDGAIVIARDLRVLGFGAKIDVESATAAQVCMFQPEQGGQQVIPSPLESVGGTRHQSAARFAAANKDSAALVISQDRHLSVVHWHDPISSVAVVRNAEWWI